MRPEAVDYKYKTTPYRHQKCATIQGIFSEYFALFMEQGTGKSKTIIDTVSCLYEEKEIDAVLLIAPNGVHKQWNDEQLPEHSPVKTKAFLWTGAKGKTYFKEMNTFINEKCLELKWFFVNIEAFSTDNNLPVFKGYLLKNRTAIIIDEATRIKNPAANRTINVSSGLCEIIRQNKKVLSITPLSVRRYVLTGMMVTNTPYDIYSLFEFLSPGFWGCNFYAFRRRYGIELKTADRRSGREYSRKIYPFEIANIRRLAGEGTPMLEIAASTGLFESDVLYILERPELNVPYKNLAELKEKIAPYCFITTKEECLDLPPKVYERIVVEMSPDQKRVYKELERRLIVEYNNHDLSVKNKLSLIGRLQQITGGFFPYTEIDGEEKRTGIEAIQGANPKLIALENDIEETGNEKIIVWARFTAEIKMLEKELKKTFPEKSIRSYFGGTPEKERGEIIAEFKSGDIDVLIINPSAGIGFNFQISTLYYYYSNSYSLEQRKQSEDRSHRSGQKNTVVYKDIIMAGTIDEKVYSVLKNKEDLLDYFRSKTIREFLTEK